MITVARFERNLLGTNKFNAKKKSDRSPGVYFSETNTTIVPSSMVNGNIKRGTLMLTANDMFRLTQETEMRIFAEADEDTTSIPLIAQRYPDLPRRKAIRAGWRDPHRSYVGKTETVHLSIFNATVTQNEIILNDDSIIAIFDGGGRLTSLGDEFQEEGDNICITNKIHFNIILDVSGNRERLLKDFLSYNRDAKKLTKGTQLCVNSTLIDEMGLDGQIDIGDMQFINIKKNQTLAPSYITRDLFKRFSEKPDTKTILKLLPWQYEGNRANMEHAFAGKGRSSSIDTAINDLIPILKKENPAMTVGEFSDIVWDGFIEFDKIYRSMSKNEQDMSTSRFHNTLSLKVMFLILCYFPTITGHTLRTIFTRYRRVYTTEFPTLGNTVNIGMAEFYRHNKWLASPEFNSGAKPADILTKQLRTVCEDVRDGKK